MLKTYCTPTLIAKGSTIDLTTATQSGPDNDLSGEPGIDRFIKAGFLL